MSVKHLLNFESILKYFLLLVNAIHELLWQRNKIQNGAYSCEFVWEKKSEWNQSIHSVVIQIKKLFSLKQSKIWKVRSCHRETREHWPVDRKSVEFVAKSELHYFKEEIICIASGIGTIVDYTSWFLYPVHRREFGREV